MNGSRIINGRPGDRRVARLVSAAVLAASGGCAQYHLPMTDSTGFQPGCHQSGFGWIGMDAAADGHEICTRVLRTAGFVERDRIGTTGLVDLQVDRGGLVVVGVAAESPAAQAGIAPGDVIVSIDAERVRDADVARRLLFGRAGAPVTLALRRDQETRAVVLVRRSGEKPPN